MTNTTRRQSGSLVFLLEKFLRVRILPLLLSVCVFVGTAWAQAPVTPSGAGTLANPYQITQLGHLVWMKANTTSSNGKYYKLMNDIDASATAGWNGGAGFEPIGGVGALNTNVSKVLSFTGLSVGTNPAPKTFRAVVDSRASVIEIVETNNQETLEYVTVP